MLQQVAQPTDQAMVRVGGGRGWSHAVRGSADCQWDYWTATGKSNTALQLYTD